MTTTRPGLKQRCLVRDNMGLVAVHLRRNVVNLHPKWEREWDELFQEGYLGLIRAATAFRAERGDPVCGLCATQDS